MSALSQSLPPSKQLRFVNNAGQPPSKRRRINAACLNCRKRKTRCAGERPVCSTCTSMGQPCLGYKQGQIATSTASDPEEARHHKRSGDPDNDNDDKFDEDAETVVTHIPQVDNNTTPPQRRASEVGQRSNAGNRGASPLRRRRVSANELSQHSQHQECDIGQKSPQQHRPLAHSRDGSQTAHIQRVDYRRSVSFQGSSHGSHGSPRRSTSHHQLLPQHPPQHHNDSHRVPYFRYFGPTAIVPGYKQMVVDVPSSDRRRSHGSSFSMSSPSTTLTEKSLSYFRSQQHHPNQGSSEMPVESLEELPVYDPNDVGQVHPIIINLVKTFFLHLGCNYPFLREQLVIRKIRDKRMEPILVDAMCALAARFSDLPIFASGNDDGEDGDNRTPRHAYGGLYAQRAKAATVDTFPCPSVAAVQACLLMAYEGFGADQDSALWMYLGIAIRMALDLGLQKNLSVDAAQGASDPLFIRSAKDNAGCGGQGRETGDGDSDLESTAKQQHSGCYNTNAEGRDVDIAADGNPGRQGIDSFDAEELRAEEQERANTFWAVFFLDRVISSGTGRPVTFRDDDFDLAFPEAVLDPVTKRPAPFPILAQIIHLYGRVSDVLNTIQSVDDLTQDKMKRLGQMERDLTQLYQRQDSRLNFDVPNFQAYVRAGQGATFILLHFWFHALIIILHQPTLLAPFGSLHRRHQLLPNSHELSMSSAKTIADILSCAELIDPKSFIGNPFTSQPMYIAACAFLTESIANASLPTSRNASPPPPRSHAQGRQGAAAGGGSTPGSADAKTAAKHALLASNANQNYQRCYKSLQQLHLYWGGVRYILSALDQKSKGIWDCETFTLEEMENTRNNGTGPLNHIPVFDNPGSPNAPPIAWSLTGTSNSANPSLTVLFQSHANAVGNAPAAQPKQNQRQPEQPRQRQHERHEQHEQQQQQQATTRPPQPGQALQFAATPPGNMVYDPVRQNLPEIPPLPPAAAYPQANISAVRYSPQIAPRQPQLSQQQVHYSQHGASFPASQGYKPDQLQHAILDDANARVAPDGQQAALYGSNDAAYHVQQQQQQQQQQQLHHGYIQHQPSYEGGIKMPGTSSTSNSLGDYSQTQIGASAAAAAAAAAAVSIGRLDGSDLHAPQPPPALQPAGFGPGDPYSYLETGPIPSVITFDSQEVDISQVPLLTDIMPQWLEYLPSNVLDLFDVNFHSAN